MSLIYCITKLHSIKGITLEETPTATELVRNDGDEPIKVTLSKDSG